MASPEPVDHGEPPSEAETHPQEEQESERRFRGLFEDSKDLLHSVRTVITFAGFVEAMHDDLLLEDLKRRTDRTNEYDCGFYPEIVIKETGTEPSDLSQVDIARMISDALAPHGDGTMDGLLRLVDYRFALVVDTACRELQNLLCNTRLVLQRLTSHPFGKDHDHVRELVDTDMREFFNVDMDGIEASLSATRQDVANCATEIFTSVHRTFGALRDTLHQLRCEAKEKCAGSHIQSACDRLDRDHQRLFLIGVAGKLHEAPFCNEANAEFVRDLWQDIIAAMGLLKAEALGDCAQKMYEWLDVKIRGELQEIFPSEFVETLQD
ncbi:hypothetical protein CKM354_000187000 [Cercospora kikuchii]|uniref:Uncharacterized protein n=1 Tax=Cercospora kikuchii TaxID=84275 RepID=A0A9P3C8W5_9PEZI|nr:uncharacterized protein CKM354_000187000 [Cercospora kikuchii]GIZ38453.1 hypothetical protein CKM354_000187000 [Cercospora kikuchii]